MNLVQHSLVTLQTVNGDMDRFKREIAFTLLPDAIRFYTGKREYSHFEINPANGETSWMQFPTDVKNFSRDNWERSEKFLAPDIPSAKTGEETQVQMFEKTNSHLPALEYMCIKRHLLQDREFDAYLRDKLDTSMKHEGKYFFLGKEVSDAKIRPLISEMENEGIVLLAKMIYENYGITVDQNWINENVIEVLREAYPEDMYRNTAKYLHVDDRIQTILQNQQYDSVEYMLDEKEQERFYSNTAIIDNPNYALDELGDNFEDDWESR